MSSEGDLQTPAFQQLTADNRGPAVIVASYIFLVISVIVVLTRLVTRFKVGRKFAVDDHLAFASTVVVIAQTIAITFAANGGLGRHQNALTESELNKYAKAFYSARVLAVPALALAKSSTNYLIMGIRPPKPLLRSCQVILAVTNIWALASLLAIIFQCTPPDVWDSEGQCVNQRALYLSYDVWNITTDIALTVLPFFLMRKVQVSTQKRWVVIALFGCRIIVPAFTIAGSVAATDYWTASPPDPTWYAVKNTLWTQAVINLSIITACIPCIKRFLADLSTGMMAVNISEPLEMTMKNYSNLESSPTPSRRGRSRFGSRMISSVKNKSSFSKSATSTLTESGMLQRPQLAPQQSRRTTKVGKAENGSAPSDGVIVHTIDYEVNYEQGRNSGLWDGRSQKA